MSDQYVSIKVPALGSISVKTIKLVVRSDEGETLASGNVAMQFDARFGDELVIMSPDMVTAMFGHPTMQHLYEKLDASRTICEDVGPDVKHDYCGGVVATGESVEKRTAEEWCREYGATIADSDGWREPDAPAWDEPITLDEFQRRLSVSTARVEDRTRLENDVANLKRRQRDI